MTPNLQERVNAALSTVRDNRLGINVLEAEMVRDVATSLTGKVRFTLLLAPSDDATLVRDVRQVVQQVDGVTDVRVDVKDASQAGALQSAAAATQLGTRDAITGLSAATSPPGDAGPAGARRKPRPLPVVGQEPSSRRAAVPAPTPVTYPNLGNIVAISSG